jgi:hypothetical protein
LHFLSTSGESRLLIQLKYKHALKKKSCGTSISKKQKAAVIFSLKMLILNHAKHLQVNLAILRKIEF